LERSPSGELGEHVVVNDEAGWDENTDPHGIVVDFVTGEEVSRRVAFTAAMVTPKWTSNEQFMFQKIFGDDEFIAAGQIIIPPGKQKPSKPARDNTYVFYVIEGAVQLKVHRSTYVLATGAMFMVPRANQYYIKNICERDAKLFFAQARKVPLPKEENRSSATPKRPLLPVHIQRASASVSPAKLKA